MSFRGDLVTYLKAHSGLSALIGTRVRARRPRQGDTYPLVTYRIASQDTEYEVEGAAGPAETRVRFVAWGGNGTDCDIAADNVNEQLRLALSGFTGTFTTTVVNSVQKDNEVDVEAMPKDGTSQPTVGIETDYIIIHQQTKPSFS